MRAVWKGAISFGLVSIPVKVVSAIGGEHSVKFHQMHRTDQGRVRYRKVCELDGEELAPNEIVRGYESSDGRVAVVTDADLADLPLPTARTIEVHGFLAADDVDPLRLGKPYYLAPDTSGAKPYVLMREALRRSDKAAVAKLAMRGHEILALVRVQEDVLVLHQLYWPDEINSTQGVAPTERVRVTDAELDMADTLIDALGTADLAEYQDEYQTAVEELVSAKLEGAEPVEAEAPGEEAGGKVIDLMAALRQSVEDAKGGRAAPEPQGADARKTASKRAPAKKAAPRRPGGAKSGASSAAGSPEGAGAAKPTARKSTARKTAGEKSTARKSTAKSAQGGKSGAKTATKRPARKTG